MIGTTIFQYSYQCNTPQRTPHTHIGISIVHHSKPPPPSPRHPFIFLQSFNASISHDMWSVTIHLYIIMSDIKYLVWSMTIPSSPLSIVPAPTLLLGSPTVYILIGSSELSIPFHPPPPPSFHHGMELNGPLLRSFGDDLLIVIIEWMEWIFTPFLEF